MILKKKEINLWQFISFLIALYLAISGVFPLLKVLPFFKIAWLLALVTWVGVVFLTKPSFFIRMPLQRFMFLFFTVYVVVAAKLFGNGTIGNRFLDVAQVPFFYLVYQYHCVNGFSQNNINIIKWTLPFLLITCLKTAFLLLTAPYLLRTIKSGGEYSLMLWRQGVGGYELVYFLALVCAVILYVLLNSKLLQLTFKVRVLLIALLALFYPIVILSNFFTALLMTFVAVFGLLTLKNRKILHVIILLLIIAIIIVLFGKQIMIFFIDSIIKMMNTGMNLKRLLIIREGLLTNDGMETLVLSRNLVYQKSLTEFLKNPIMGNVVNPLGYQGDFLDGFGQHSQFLDTFALFGIIIGFVQIYYVLQPFVIRIKTYAPLAGFSFVMLLLTIILFTFNNITTSVGLAIFLIYPVTFDWMRTRMESIPINVK